MKKNTKKMSGAKKVLMAEGMAALGAGAYYLLGPDAKSHQKKASGLVSKIKKEVEKDAKKLKTEWKKIKTK